MIEHEDKYEHAGKGLKGTRVPWQ